MKKKLSLIHTDGCSKQFHSRCEQQIPSFRKQSHCLIHIRLFIFLPPPSSPTLIPVPPIVLFRHCVNRLQCCIVVKVLIAARMKMLLLFHKYSIGCQEVCFLGFVPFNVSLHLFHSIWCVGLLFAVCLFIEMMSLCWMLPYTLSFTFENIGIMNSIIHQMSKPIKHFSSFSVFNTGVWRLRGQKSTFYK